MATFTTIRVEVADYLGLGRDSAAWSATDTARLSAIISAGYRRFLQPPGHRWSFLEPVTTLSITSGTETYDAPTGFGWVVGDLTYAADDGRWHSVRVVSEARVRAERQRSNGATGAPTMIAVRPVVMDGSAEQSFKLEVFPNPDGDYTLSMRYGVAITDPSEASPYLYGGALYGDVILQACLAMAELRMRGEAGAQEAMYQALLAGAIERDRKNSAAWHGDYGGRGHDYMDTYEVTYNGTLYDGT